MRKLLFILLIIFLPFQLFAHPNLILNGPYGGKAELSCTSYNLSGNDFGGECSVYYVDYSVLPGIKLNGGPLDIGYSILYSQNSIWIDFEQTEFPIKLTINSNVYDIEVSKYFSFECNLKTLKCEKVQGYGTAGSQSVIKINGVEYPVNPGYLHYFLHIFN